MANITKRFETVARIDPYQGKQSRFMIVCVSGVAF
jgi:hypothetical protein